MTNTSPWFFDGPNRNRWFTVLKHPVDLSMANCIIQRDDILHPESHWVAWFQRPKKCLPIKNGLVWKLGIPTTSFWGMKVRPKIMSKGVFPTILMYFPLVPMVFPWFSPNIYHFSSWQEMRVAKETLATEQAKAASKEQLAKAMKDLCYATLLSSLLGFFGHMGISMKNWTLKIWEKNNL